ncbi:SDR family oxidoreductase [Streptomyces sp. CA-111067]|uniref:SDR family oxidoreductase n=1 Tax=Streptomyces sp. CA-111067 TaxID=3240046 RepID=UPI003D99F015
MRVAVSGGTGVAGRLVVAALSDAGHDPVVIARSTGVNLLTGDGLDAALAGAEAVIDASNVTTTSRGKSVRFFETAGRRLLDAEQKAGVRHHVTLSIVGIDRVDYGYYFGKRRQEELAKAGPVPWTVLRATQFHEFADQMLANVPGPFALVPKMLSRPVAVSEVADALVQLALGEPQGMAPELAGPRDEQMVDMARRLLRARSSRRKVLPLRLPGAAGKAMATGALLPTEDGPRGKTTFADWLTTQTTPTA